MDTEMEDRPEQNPPTVGAGIEVQTKTTVTTPGPPNTTVKKVIVAVHGVGEQYSYATIQSVVNQFYSFYRQPAGIPLGNFHTGKKTFLIQPPYLTEPFERFAFAEVYWAKIPRKLVDEKYTLEEAKQWARTIVERLRLRWQREGWKGDCRDEDFDLLGQVLTEMIQTIAVLERICYLADRAGVFTFDLRKLIDDYLGDVQVVTEFTAQRGEILQAFADVMDEVHQSFPQAKIYLIAHSEGTVVSLLGLLKGFRDSQPPGWTSQVRGFMTLGSPIDKHLALWPELFGEDPPVPRPPAPEKIEWRNYYDHGDPIGFALEDARDWLHEYEWDGVFNFTDHDDIGFTRYPFPGKAHVDYWTDEAVFDHFISTVVSDEPPKKNEGRTENPSTRPGDKPQNRWLSYVVPYLGVASLLFIAVYVLYKAVASAIDPNVSMTGLVGQVAGITGLLYGTTIVARVPRLTRSTLWRGIALGLGGISAAAYLWSARGAAPIQVQGYSIPDGAITVALAIVLIGLVFLFSIWRPSWGLKPLIIIGTAVAAAKVGHHLLTAGVKTEAGPLWPVVIALVGFLYLWWLAALLFDLIFIWHLYIRHSRMLQRMDEILGGSRNKDRARKTGTGTMASGKQVEKQATAT